MREEDYWGGPEKIIVSASSDKIIRVQPRTISLEIGLPFSEDMESAIIWILVREFRGVYFTFRTHVSCMGSLPPTRVLSARFWFDGKINDPVLVTELKDRMKELLRKAEAFASPSSFLINQCNADFLSKIIKNNHQDQPETTWLIWERG